MLLVIVIHCDKKRCLWKEHGEELIGIMKAFEDELQVRKSCANNLIRKEGYQNAVRLIHGSLGEGRRVKLPKCIEKGIRAAYPNSSNGGYMGFKEK